MTQSWETPMATNGVAGSVLLTVRLKAFLSLECLVAWLAQFLLSVVKSVLGGDRMLVLDLVSLSALSLMVICLVNLTNILRDCHLALLKD